MSDLYVSWSDYHRKIESLAVNIYQSGWKFNQIVCLARGGLRIGDILSRLYRQPLAILCAASYEGEDSRQRGEVVFAEHLTMVNQNLGCSILLVDDLVDSGFTLQQAIQWLTIHHSPLEIRTAVLWWKDCSIIKPDYYVDYLPDNPWIHQPFEYYEQVSLEQLSTEATSG